MNRGLRIKLCRRPDGHGQRPALKHRFVDTVALLLVAAIPPPRDRTPMPNKNKDNEDLHGSVEYTFSATVDAAGRGAPTHGKPTTAGSPAVRLRSVSGPAHTNHRSHHVLRAPAGCCRQQGVPSDRDSRPGAGWIPERHAEWAINPRIIANVMARGINGRLARWYGAGRPRRPQLATTAVRAIM